MDGKTTIPGFRADMNRVLSCFSPRSKDRDVLYPKDRDDIDSFFGGGRTMFLSGGFSGLDDFELICFMVVT